MTLTLTLTFRKMTYSEAANCLILTKFPGKIMCVPRTITVTLTKTLTMTLTLTLTFTSTLTLKAMACCETPAYLILTKVSRNFIWMPNNDLDHDLEIDLDLGRINCCEAPAGQIFPTFSKNLFWPRPSFDIDTDNDLDLGDWHIVKPQLHFQETLHKC